MGSRADFIITDASVSIENIDQIISNNLKISLDKNVIERVKKSRSVIEDILQSDDKAIYGVTTGFGKFADVRISPDNIDELQHRIVLSHAAGVGDPMPEEIVRIMMLIKIISLSQGYSGIRLQTLQLLIDLFNQHIVPVVPSKGSVGASGDLAPLAHMALVLIGEGEAFTDSKRMKSEDALKSQGLEAVQLRAKEGLAILNGTQAINAYAVHNIIEAQKLIAMADLIGAMSLETLNGTLTAFDPRIHAVRRHNGQQRSAQYVRHLLKGSEIVSSHSHSDHRVQDAYCLRCIPQVHGTVRDTVEYVKSVVLNELNAVTDNPLVFPDQGDVLSGGNFHGEPIGMVMDFLAIALSELGSISERRIAHYMDQSMSELPAFLVEEGGINSGYMMAHVTAAALVSENKTLSHPATVDSIPTSSNKEDHVSMGTWAARKCYDIVDNIFNVLAIELLCAAQGLDFRKPLKPALVTEEVYNLIRRRIPFWKEDRWMSRDIEIAKEVLRSNEIIGILEEINHNSEEK